MALIYYITQVQFDFGAIKLLKQECERSGIHRPLIVTDAGVRAAGLLQKALDALPGMSPAVFDETPSNPTEAAVRAAASLYKAQGCDGLIAVGGGSAIDCAKGVAIAATHEGPLKTYATIEGGSPKITDRVAPLIAVPTTAGTGSEVARGAILIVDDGRKLGFHSWHLVPKTAICDPELTLGLPRTLTAATGPTASTGDEVPRLVQGYLETSNANPSQLMTQLVEVARSYEAAQKLVQNQDELLGKTISSLGRIG